MTRLLFLTHRYLGIAVSVLMLGWCLSGFVMLYESYPVLSEAQRTAGLQPLAVDHCCAPAASGGVLAAGTLVQSARVEMLGGRAVASVRTAEGARQVIDLASGRPARVVTAAEAREVAARFAVGSGLTTDHISIGSVTRDQWTVSGYFNPDRPLYRISYGDAAGSELYVSSATGRAVQFTTTRQRFWNWLGAVPHWVYFTSLRSHARAWTQIIIYTSLLGSFLTASGIWIGVRQYLRRPAQRVSPYRGYMLWHHVPGLVFGAFLLTWVVSGLLSMNPWGLLEGEDTMLEDARLMGGPPHWDEVLAGTEQILQRSDRRTLVSLRIAPLGGQLYFIGATAQGARLRLDATGAAAALTAPELTLASRLLDATQPLQLLNTGDAYYYPHHSDAITLPVYRAVLPDQDDMRYYLDPVSGELLRKVDAGERGYRWLHKGLHRLDFSAALRTRPVWDILMIILLGGATVIAATGLYGAVLRLSR